LLGEADVWSVTEPSGSLEVLVRSTARCTVSPGTRFVAATERRFAAPDAPSAIETVPELIDWLADVELVKLANVPRPATLAATPRTASEPKILIRIDCFIGDLILRLVNWTDEISIAPIGERDGSRYESGTGATPQRRRTGPTSRPR
jgi:hypothetical protein